MTDSTNSVRDKAVDYLNTFIESWLPINVKDAQHVKEAKVAARNEFVTTLLSLITEAETKARYDEANNLLIGSLDYEDFVNRVTNRLAALKETHDE